MPLIIDLGLKEEANKLGLGSFDLKLYRLVKGNAKTEHYSILTRVLLKAGPRPSGSAAHGPRRPGGQVLIFYNFFVRRQIHAHAQICIWFGRANFEFGYHFNNHLNPFRSFLSVLVVKRKTLSFSVYSSVDRTL